MSERDLDWDGCFNARDLGGLAGADGRVVRRGAIVRSDALDALTEAGWDSVLAYGVRTMIDLRNDDERKPHAWPAAISTVHLALDAVEDEEFWLRWGNGPEVGTPLYYAPHLVRHPERSARVIAAIAHAEPGGVVFHCVGGRDRTGMIAMLVLWLLGVSAEDIAADYALSAPRLARFFASRGQPDQNPKLERFLAEHGTSAPAVITQTLQNLDVPAWMRAGGITPSDLDALRARLLE
jgi:protein-tyrosine phosphatase